MTQYFSTFKSVLSFFLSLELSLWYKELLSLKFSNVTQLLSKFGRLWLSQGPQWPSELSFDPEEMFCAVLCVWNFHVCPPHWCENRRNGKRVYTSNCNNVKTSSFITVSPAWSRFTKLTQLLQTMSRLVCDTQYGSGKDTVFHWTAP